MRLIFTFWLGSLLFFALSCKENGQKETVSVKQVADSATLAFESRLFKLKADSLFEQYNFNGIVSVSRNGKLLYERAQGFEDFKTQKPLTTGSVFAVASISKQFTAALILRLEEQQLLNVSDKAAEYLPELNKNFPEVTLSQILTHTSGVSDFGDAPLFAPGEKYSYSNKGYYLLGRIAEKVSAKPLKILYGELFKEAGMTASATADNFQGENFASAHLEKGENFVEVANMPERLVAKSISIAAGGLLSSAGDLHKWNFALHEGKILQTEMLRKLREEAVQTDHYFMGKIGYSYGLMSSSARPKAYFHSGYVKGSASLLVYYPESKISVVILSNAVNAAVGKVAIFTVHSEVKKRVDEQLVSASVLNEGVKTAMVP